MEPFMGPLSLKQARFMDNPRLITSRRVPALLGGLHHQHARI